MEELIDNDGTVGLWVQLTDPGNQHCPGHTTRETHDVGINGTPLRPKLDGPQGQAERRLFGYQFQYVVRNSGAVQRTQFGIVKTAQQVVVEQIPLGSQGGYFGECSDPGKDEIDADVGVLELDDWNEGIGHGGQIGDGSGGRQLLEQAGEELEEVLSGNVFRCDDEGIDIGAWAEDTQAVTAIGKDSAARRFLDGWALLVHPLGDFLDEDVGDGLE